MIKSVYSPKVEIREKSLNGKGLFAKEKNIILDTDMGNRLYL